MNAVQTFKLTKKFDGLVAVNDIDLEINKGELFSLLGPNGAGKTTTIRMLCCLLKPTSGTASIHPGPRSPGKKDYLGIYSRV